MTDPAFNTDPNASGASAGLLPRFVARLIDGLIIGIVAGGILGALGLGQRPLGVLVPVIVYVYFVVMDMQFGFTLGKKILGLSVQGANGAKPTIEQAAIREAWNLVQIVPLLGPILSLAAAIAIAVTVNGSVTKQGIHDQLAKGTRVIKA